MYILTLLIVILSMSPSWATTYYTSKSGSNGNPCSSAQNPSAAKLTIGGGLGCLAAGDTLIVLDGTYVEAVTLGSMPPGVSGTPTNRITVKAQNRRQAVIAPGGASTRGITVTRAYVTIEGFSVDCTSTAPGDNTACISNNVTSGIDGIWLIDNEFHNSQGGGMLVGGGVRDWIIEKNTVHDNGWATDYHNSNGLYLPSIQHSIIRRNEIYHNECNGIRFGNSTAGTYDATDNIAEYNYIHNNGDGFGGVENCGSDGAGILIGGQRNTARYNVIAHQYRVGIWFYSLSSNIEIDNVAYNNTIYDVSMYGIATRLNVQNSVAKNNHITGFVLGGTQDLGTGTVFSSNRTTGVVTDCTVSTSDFTQKSGSACINAGVPVGLPYNGSAPDIGAFETFTFSSCKVPFGAANTIQITFSSNVNGLGDVLTTFTARRNGVSNALTTSASKLGDTIISLPLTLTYIEGDTADISWASGGLTDNARIGNTMNQPFLQTLTNQSCANNSGGEATFTFTQESYIYHGIYGTEASPDIRSAESAAAYSMVQGGALRLRFAVVCGGGNCDPTGFYLRYSTGGIYDLVPDVFTSSTVAMCGTTYVGPDVPNDRETTTNQLSTGGTFVPGAMIFTAAAIPTVTLLIGNKTELEYCVRAAPSALGVHTFRLYRQTGEALDTYTATPSVDVTEPRAQLVF